MSKRFIIIVLALVLGFGGIFYFTKHKSSGTTAGGSSNATPSNHVMGLGKKKVTLIEYGDYQCPACGAYYPLVKQLTTTYQNDIYFQFRNFPLYQIHQNAFAGGRAAEAAGLQGKYWDMHDLLYVNQQAWSSSNDPTSYFTSYAQSLGLNVDKFKTDMASDQVNNVINADIKAGTSLGANSTPTFILDGKKINSNPRDLPSFQTLINAEIKAKNAPS